MHEPIVKNGDEWKRGENIKIQQHNSLYNFVFLSGIALQLRNDPSFLILDFFFTTFHVVEKTVAQQCPSEKKSNDVQYGIIKMCDLTHRDCSISHCWQGQHLRQNAKKKKRNKTKQKHDVLLIHPNFKFCKSNKKLPAISAILADLDILFESLMK